MNTFKYILIHIETILMILSFILGTGAAESSMWWEAFALLFGPFIWGYFTNYENRIHFCEVYSRAWSISLKCNK